MEITKVHLLFEQSGTFKRAFLNLGIPAEDYDILNDFGETDHQIDIFNEIEQAYKGDASIFDNIKKTELVIAFFPCTRFESNITMAFRGEQYQLKDFTDEQKITYSMKLHEELTNLYMLISKLFCVMLRGGLRMVVENPYTQPHYLTSYFPIKPKIIDKNRRINGDYYKKPTQYWFVNCDPEDNLVFEPIEYVPQKIINNNRNQIVRSLIHPQYAYRFIKRYLIGGEA